MGVGNAARDFPFLLNGELAPGTTEEMLQAGELMANVTSDNVIPAHHDFPEWLELKQQVSVSNSVPFSLPLKENPPSWLSSPTKLTSQLARPPLPHLCSLRVCKKSKQRLCHVILSPTLSLCRRPWRRGVPAPPTYQVFEFCGEAAIVGFFHVHHFRVCAQNVKFPRSESQEKNQPHKVTESPKDKVRLNRTKESPWAELTLWELQRPRNLCEEHKPVLIKQAPCFFKKSTLNSCNLLWWKNCCAVGNFYKLFNYIYMWNITLYMFK